MNILVYRMVTRGPLIGCRIFQQLITIWNSFHHYKNIELCRCQQNGWSSAKQFNTTKKKNHYSNQNYHWAVYVDIFSEGASASPRPIPFDNFTAYFSFTVKVLGEFRTFACTLSRRSYRLMVSTSSWRKIYIRKNKYGQLTILLNNFSKTTVQLY